MADTLLQDIETAITDRHSISLDAEGARKAITIIASQKELLQRAGEAFREASISAAELAREIHETREWRDYWKERADEKTRVEQQTIGER